MQTPIHKCPGCGANNDGALRADLKAKMPKPGNFSICSYCQHVGKYTELLTIESLTEEELEHIRLTDPMLFRTIKNLIKKFKDEGANND